MSYDDVRFIAGASMSARVRPLSHTTFVRLCATLGRVCDLYTLLHKKENYIHTVVTAIVAPIQLKKKKTTQREDEKETKLSAIH